MRFPEDQDWLAACTRLRAAGQPHVLVTVTAAEGSTPRESGTKMVVTADTLYATIGGGALEHEATRMAREMLSDGRGQVDLERMSLGPRLRQCCGGRVTLLFEPFLTRQKCLYLYGAGHVGKQVVDVLAGLPLRIIWVDSRADQFPESVRSGVQVMAVDDPVSVAETAPDDAFHLVMTHDHDLDLELVDAILHNPFAWAGLIASASKKARFSSRLLGVGIAQEVLDRLVCPIGIEGISGKQPRVIALSVAAQMMQAGLHEPSV